MQLWDTATGKLERTLPGAFATQHSRTAIAFSPDGATLATCSAGNGISPIRLWDVASGKEKDPILCRREHGVKLAFSPDGKTLAAVAEDGAIDRWSLPEGKPLKSTPLPRRDSLRYRHPDLHPAGLRFLENERLVAWGVLCGRMLAWDAPGGKMLTEDRGHLADVFSVQSGPQDRELVTTGSDFRVLRWDPSGKPLGVVKLNDARHYLCYQLAREATRALAWGLVLDLATGEELFSLPFSRPFLSAGSARVAGFTGSRHSTELPACEVWDLETRRRVGRFELPANAELGGGVPDSIAALSPDGTRLVAAVRLRVSNSTVSTVVTGWDVRTGKKLAELTIDYSDALSIAAASNSSCAVSRRDGKLWEVNFERGISGKVIDTSKPETAPFLVPTFSPEGKRLAAGVRTGKREWTVRVYDWPEGHLLHSFTGHTGAVTALAFSSNGTTLASGSADGTVLLWDLRLLGGK